MYFEILTKYKKQEFLHSTSRPFGQSKFFNQLPPQLQSKLVTECLDHEIQLTNFFLNDLDFDIKADRTIVHQIVANLKF
jgi:hypothetical protein